MRYIAIIALLALGCKKEQKRCYSCSTYITFTYNYPSLNTPTTHGTADQCNMTETEINAFMARNTATNTIYMHDTIRTERDSTYCTPK